MYDVAIIGAGPTGLSAAALLAQDGHKVILLERQPTKYGLPRAGHVDHEIVRVLQGLGAHKPIIEDAPDPEAYTWYNGNAEILLSFPFGTPSISGYQADFMIFQPVLDDALYKVLEGYPENAEILFGTQVVGVHQRDQSVVLNVAKTERGDDGKRRITGNTFNVEARYVISADGAGSSVRDLIGATRSGPRIDERWYTVDLAIKKPLPFGINGQWCDPKRPTYIGPLGRNHQRFEMKVLPHETDEDFDEEFTWALLAKWGVTAEHVDIYRRVVYAFEAKISDRWNMGRVFLAGDAAHTMPPFMGQGLCSGIRDSANLAWKLDLVLRGVSTSDLLDTYQSERQPHTQRWTEISVAVGAVSCELDPGAAAARDQRFFAGTQAPLPGSPAIGSGLFRGKRNTAVVSPSGDFFPQANVRFEGREGLLHDLVGGGFILLTSDEVALMSLSDFNREFLAEIGATLLALGDGTKSSTIEDVAGTYATFFQKAGATAILVRPDYYVFGAAFGEADLSALIFDFYTGVGAYEPVHKALEGSAALRPEAGRSTTRTVS